MVGRIATNQNGLKTWLRVGIVFFGLVCLAAFCLLIPMSIMGRSETLFEGHGTLLTVFAEIAVIPCILAMISAWKITIEIGKDNSFSKENVKNMKHIAFYSLAEGTYLLILSVWFAVNSLDKGIDGLFLAALLFSLISGAVALAAFCLSHLIQKAAKIKEENDSIV